MVYCNTITIKTSTDSIFRFFEELPRTFNYWHLDHLNFRWVKSSGIRVGTVFYFEENIGGDFLSTQAAIRKVVPNRYLEFVPMHWYYRLLISRISFTMQENSIVKSQATIEMEVRNLGLISRRLFGTKIEALVRHMLEEGGNLQALLQSNRLWFVKPELPSAS